jgi:phage gpG-like protein
MPNPLADLAFALDASEMEVQFALLAGRFEDYSPVLKSSVVATLREMKTLHFETKGALFDKQWAALAPETIRDRARQGYPGDPIMVREGRLRQSLARAMKTPDSIVEVSRFGLVFGTSVPYADFHQQTKGPGKGIIPERQVIPDPIPEAVVEEIRENIRDYLIEGRIRRRSSIS